MKTINNTDFQHIVVYDENDNFEVFDKQTNEKIELPEISGFTEYQLKFKTVKQFDELDNIKNEKDFFDYCKTLKINPTSQQALDIYIQVEERNQINDLKTIENYNQFFDYLKVKKIPTFTNQADKLYKNWKELKNNM